MEEKLFEFFNLTKDEIDETINDFIKNNSNECGIDLSKIYLAALTYRPETPGINQQQDFGINCPINKANDYNKLTIVFILRSQSETDHVFIDIFNKSILQSTYVNIYGLLSFFPQVRRGTTVYEYNSLKDILDINRLSYENLESIFSFISKTNKEELTKLSKEELSKMLLSQISDDKIKQINKTL